MEENRREVQRIANSGRSDRRTRTWYGVLFFARPLNMQRIRTSLRKS